MSKSITFAKKPVVVFVKPPEFVPTVNVESLTSNGFVLTVKLKVLKFPVPSAKSVPVSVHVPILLPAVP